MPEPTDTPTYTWAQIEEAICEIRLESFGLASCCGVTEKDGQLTARGVIIVNLQRKLHQLFPGEEKRRRDGET